MKMHGQTTVKLSVKFNEDQSNGTRVVPCGQTDITKLIGCFSQLDESACEQYRTHYVCQFLGYLGGVAEVSILIECDCASIDNRITTFRGKSLSSSSRV